MEYEELSQKLIEFSGENEMLRESYASMAQAILAFDDAGWNTAEGQAGENGFTLEQLKDSAARIRETSEGNPLLKRGAGLRTSYVFGKGIHFGKQPARVKRLMDLPQNQNVVFSPEAQVVNERSHFTDGQFFLLANVATKTFQRIPFKEITAVVTSPDDAEEVRYYRRTWIRREQELAGGQVRETELNVWYPADTYKPQGRYATRIQNQPVDAKYLMFASCVNRRAGNVWGLPDAFPALPWAHAYNEFLKDGSRMLKALSMFAWQLKSKTKVGATNAAAAIATPSTAGSTAVVGADMELSSLPRTGGTIDLTNGRPLGSMVASALEVSVVALLSDPGTSGAYGTAATLDAPTVKAMESRQNVWIMFYKRVLEFLGATNLDVNFPKIDTEPSQRMTQALALAYEGGAIWQDEYREAIIETLDIPKLHDTVPESSPSDNGGSAIPSQGNSGSVGSMQDNSNDLAQADAEPTA
nr:MAG TPA: portal [Caudoviricetes sp.]